MIATCFLFSAKVARKKPTDAVLRVALKFP